MLLLKITFLFFTFLYNLKRYQKSRGGKNNKEPPRIFLSLFSLTAPWDQILSRDMSNDKDSQGIHLWYPAFYQKLNSWYSSIFGPQISFSCLTNRPPLSRSLKFNSTRVLRWFSVLCIYLRKIQDQVYLPKHKLIQGKLTSYYGNNIRIYLKAQTIAYFVIAPDVSDCLWNGWLKSQLQLVNVQ